MLPWAMPQTVAYSHLLGDGPIMQRMGNPWVAHSILRNGQSTLIEGATITWRRRLVYSANEPCVVSHLSGVQRASQLLQQLRLVWSPLRGRR